LISLNVHLLFIRFYFYLYPYNIIQILVLYLKRHPANRLSSTLIKQNSLEYHCIITNNRIIKITLNQIQQSACPMLICIS